MPKLNLKKSRTKSYAEKLLERQERMNLIDRQEVVFMPGDDLSDNEENDAPLEVLTKREIFPVAEEELPEITVQIKEPPPKQKPKISRVAEGEFVVKINNSVKLKIKAEDDKFKPSKHKMSFRERLLLANTKGKRSKRQVRNAHVEKWHVRGSCQLPF